MNLKQEIESRHRKFSLSWKEFSQRKQCLQNYEFDKYKIVKKIGSGSFATVYLGLVVQSSQQVAIKVINLKQLNDIKNERLKQIKLRLAHSQSRIMMHFSSHNIIKCYETFQSQDFKFMILQYCNGGDLGQKIEKEGKLFQDEAISMMKQIVNGLGECHSKGIIHRDLKPDNIMLHNGVCKLADFGFSKMLTINTENQNQTCMNTTLGTPTTMAPQVKNFEPYGLKADIWSIGVIFFNMLFGKCPFESKQNFNKIMLRISGVLQKQQFYEGVKINDKVRRFLKQVLVVNPQQRLGWKGLIRHEIFEQEESSQQQLNHQQQGLQEQNSSLQYSAITLRKSCFQRRVSLKIDEQKMAKLQTEIVIELTKNEGESKSSQAQQSIGQNNNNNKQQSSSQKEIYNLLKSLRYCDELIIDKIQDNSVQNNKCSKKKQEDGSEIQNLNIKQCTSQMVDPPPPTIPQHEESLLYQWARYAYLQCQKTEVIYNKIILPLESLKLLEMTQRKSIQFMYLLCTRCYNNMAPVYYVFQNNKNSEVIQQLTQMIQRLYSTVEKKWRRYSYLLAKKENQKLQMAVDWTKRAILSKLFPQSYDYERRQKFMTGIQCVNNYYRLSLEVFEGAKDKVIQRQPGHGKYDLLIHKQQSHVPMKDYTREQQIQYTIEYYNHTKDKFLNRERQQSKEVMSYLNNFAVICNLALQDLKNIPFKRYIEELLSASNQREIRKK